MKVYIDTSAFLAVLDAGDRNHRRAKAKWTELVTTEAALFCSNYILVETFALAQRRLGMEAVRALNDDILLLVNIDWIDEAAHRAGVSALLAASRKRLSLVDCLSFESMRRMEIKTAFAFDAHFEEHGFFCIP